MDMPEQEYSICLETYFAEENGGAVFESDIALVPYIDASNIRNRIIGRPKSLFDLESNPR